LIVRKRNVLLAALLMSFAGRAWAGPPFLTDDPEPVAAGHWEFYAAAEWSWARESASGTAPHFEVNYGAMPGLQLHAVVPFVLSWDEGQVLHYGFGDVEVGTKLRLVEEGDWSPQVGIFPVVTWPTGSAEQGLGAGVPEGLLPVWLQKSFGPWTTYGGGGLRFAADGHAVVLGWLLQRDFGGTVTVGLEAYCTIPLDGSATAVQLDAGAIINLSELQHLLLSAGPSLGGDAAAQAYLGYQLTI
jgi:hypothetical protein